MCWGEHVGAPANGELTASLVPVEVPRLGGGITTITAGGGHTCAVIGGGGVSCWGANYAGQLGDGTTRDRHYPVDVSGLGSGVIAVAAGSSHACALTNAGGVSCWGANDAGALGDGSTVGSDTPVQVKGLASGITAIAAGYSHTCALASAGWVKCWGSNYVGELGDGSTTDRGIPVDVSGLGSGVVSVTASRHTCALMNSGSVTCWGDNSHSQLGAGTSISSVVPVDVSSLASGVMAIAAGEIHTCALMNDGSVKCWGDNFVGQLGVVPPCDSSIAVDVAFGTHPRSPPTPLPVARIGHASGATDVVLRLDSGPDLGASELTGEFFQPGPEFTLYGDGTVIFRGSRAKLPAADGPILRARPFTVARLDADEVQALLRFAIGVGGVEDACERYENRDTDSFGSITITARTSAVDKHIEVAGPNPLEALIQRLRDFDPGSGVSTEVWEGERYWGSLFEVAPYLESGVLPDPDVAGTLPWPWPGIGPDDFVGRDEGGYIGIPRRVLSARDAAVLGLSHHGGLVQRVYLVDPDGETVYSFSLWPMSPDERS
jgi:hypothetical protein